MGGFDGAPWPDGPFLAFDTETTGLRPDRDRIVSAALVRRTGAGTTVRTWLIDPGVPIPEPASAVHGITTEQARAGGRPAAESIAEIAAAIAVEQRAGVPLVAFNATFDLTILDAELRRYGLATLRLRLGRAVGPVLDPLALDRALDGARQGGRRLADLCAYYGLRTPADLHRAEVDAEATLAVLRALLGRYPALARMPPEQVHAFQAAGHRDRAERVRARRLRQGRRPPEPRWPVAD